ncbi:MAG: peroxiredoxin [Ignavibacteriaceae bacterium]|nr:peroxiredoxin [Ignavibacteriaceae bacterium]
MLGVGQKFPDFTKTAVVSVEKGKEYSKISYEDIKSEGKWLIIFWYPNDFSFICPTEILEFDRNQSDFRYRNAEIIGASTDSEYVHLAWRKNHPELNGIKIPLIADTSKSLAEDLGVLTVEDKVAYRVTFIVDPDGIVRWVCANDLNVGRNVKEVLRVLDALQTDELCPCNWKKGDPTLKV